jgi:hypothetical protein
MAALSDRDIAANMLAQAKAMEIEAKKYDCRSCQNEERS